MTLKNIFIAAFIAFAWGMNFISIKFAFEEMPPLLFISFRFALTLFPAIFILRKPDVPWKTLIWIGLFQWVLHFSLMFSGIYLDVPVGIASLLAQCQIIFTIIFAYALFKSQISFHQIIGIALSFAGLVIIGSKDGFGGNLLGYILILGAAVASAVSNMLFRRLKQVNMVAMIVWSTIPALPPMILMTIFIEGWESFQTSMSSITWVTISSLLYTVVFSTLLGYGLWSYLMNRCDPSKVVPFALLIPVVGMTAGYFILDEILSTIDIIACGLILFGLVINQIQLKSKVAVLSKTAETEKEIKRAA